MSIFSALKDRFARRRALQNFEDNARSIYCGTPDALAVAAVYRCVRIVCDSIATMPLLYQRRRADGLFVPFSGSALYDLLSIQPCEGWGAFQFWSLVVRRMLLDGVAYVIPVYGDNGAIESLRVTRAVTRVPDQSVVAYDVDDQALPAALNGRYYDREIIVLRGASDMEGYPESLSDAAAAAIAIASAGDNEALERILNGGTSRVILTSAGAQGFGGPVDSFVGQSATQMEQKVKSGQRVIAAPFGVDVKQLGESSASMQLQTVREFTVREICRFFGVPPIFVYSDGSSNYKSAEMASADLLTNTLTPIMRNIECELHRKLIPRRMWHQQRIVFNPDGRLALDLTSRAQWYKALIELGVKSPNDLRREMNVAPVEHGDRVYRSANLQPLDLLTPYNNQSAQNDEKK